MEFVFVSHAGLSPKYLLHAHANPYLGFNEIHNKISDPISASCLSSSTRIASLKNQEKTVITFSPKLNKYVTTGGARHLKRLKVALRG